MNSFKAGMSEGKAKAIGLASMAAVLLALAAFSLYDHAVMRRNFRDLYTLILKQSTASGAKADSATPTRPPAAVETAGLPRLGSDSAPLEMVLVSDFECPFCDAVGSKAIAALRKKFVDRGLLRIYYLSMPLASHKKGQEAALAAFAAHAQGRFWEMYDELFSGAPLETELYEGAARRLGLDLEKFRRDMQSASVKAEAKRHVRLAEALYLPGVPAIVFDGQVLVGEQAWAGLEATLSDRLSETAGGASVEAFGLLSRLPGAVILDVRTAAEFASGSIKGALNIDVNSTGFSEAVAKAVPKDAPILVYCKSGKRSAMAWHQLRAAGYKDIVNLDGGIDAWNAEIPR